MTRTVVLSVRATRSELSQIREVAISKGFSTVSDYVRTLLNQEVTREKSKAA